MTRPEQTPPPADVTRDADGQRVRPTDYPAVVHMRQTIARRVVALRALRDMSGRQLANAADVSTRLIRRVENAESDIQLGTLHAISTALGVHVADLIDDRPAGTAARLDDRVRDLLRNASEPTA